MNYFFLEVDSNDKVIQQHAVAWGDEGPPAMPEPMEGNVCIALAEPISLSQPTPTSEPLWQNDALVWVETSTLANLKTAAYAKCFADINAMVWDAVGNMTEEYKDAEVEARAFKAGGYVGEVPGMVAPYADKESQSAIWATDDIIARADAFSYAKKAMRTHRMARQKEMTAATTLTQLDAAVDAWNAFMTQLRALLEL